MWDLCDPEKHSETKLVEKAVKGTLTKAEENMLIESLKAVPELASSWGLTPENMPPIISLYPKLSFEIFNNLNDNLAISEYVLITIDIILS